MQGLQSKWFAVYTQSRSERVALENLERPGHCILPLAIIPSQRHSNNYKPFIETQFPRYVFLRVVPDNKKPIEQGGSRHGTH